MKVGEGEARSATAAPLPTATTWTISVELCGDVLVSGC